MTFDIVFLCAYDTICMVLCYQIRLCSSIHTFSYCYLLLWQKVFLTKSFSSCFIPASIVQNSYIVWSLNYHMLIASALFMFLLQMYMTTKRMWYLHLTYYTLSVGHICIETVYWQFFQWTALMQLVCWFLHRSYESYELAFVVFHLKKELSKEQVQFSTLNVAPGQRTDPDLWNCIGVKSCDLI